MNSRLVDLALTGPPGAGKTTVGRMLDGFGYGHLELGSIALEFVKRQYGNRPEDWLEGEGELLRHYGSGWLWSVCGERIKERVEEVCGASRPLCLDSFKAPSEIGNAARLLGRNLMLVGVVAPAGVRRQRLTSRGRFDPPDYEERMAKRGVYECMRAADVEIHNSASLAHLHERIRSVVQ